MVAGLSDGNILLTYGKPNQGHHDFLVNLNLRSGQGLRCNRELIELIIVTQS